MKSSVSPAPPHAIPPQTTQWLSASVTVTCNHILYTVARGLSQTQTRRSLSSGHWWLPAICKTKVSKVATSRSQLHCPSSGPHSLSSAMHGGPFPPHLVSTQPGNFLQIFTELILCSESLPPDSLDGNRSPRPATEVPFCSPHSLSLSICCTFSLCHLAPPDFAL